MGKWATWPGENLVLGKSAEGRSAAYHEISHAAQQGNFTG